MANKGKPSEGDQDKPLDKPGEARSGEEQDLADALAAEAEATAAAAAAAAEAAEALEEPEALGAGEFLRSTAATGAPPTAGAGDAESAEFAANAWALNQFLQILRGGGPIPITFQPGSQTKEFEKKGEFNDRLVGKRPVPLPRGPESCLRPASVAFPPCSDMLLALPTLSGYGAGDEIVGFFKDYFRYCDHTILIGDSKLDGLLDSGLLDCTEKWTENLSASPCNPPIVTSAP
ncbi:MAG TPA: hypothetical protein VEX88_03295, partial [Glaciibacter sp.]|nr:hypothetical protein [Glaciibacter sp.]